MIYDIADAKSTYGWLNYDHAKSLDYRLFFKGRKLETSGRLDYQARNESSLREVHRHHMIASAGGPHIVSQQLKDVIETAAPEEVEFFPANVFFKGQKVEGYYAMNPLYRLDCVDMAKSEYKQANFDNNNPSYSFYYEVLLDEIPYGAQISICNEFSVQIIVSQAIKNECFSRGLKGLRFCRVIDFALGDRYVCETI